MIAQGLPRAFAAAPSNRLRLGVVIAPYGAPEERLRMVHELGFPTCFSLHGRLHRQASPLTSAHQYRDLLDKYQLTATTVEVVGPPPLKWNFTQGPDTIGVVPPKTRAARIDALRQASDFAKLLGIPQVQTHCGFIPGNPGDALYPQAVEAIRTVAKHCQGNGQVFPDGDRPGNPDYHVARHPRRGLPNLGVGLDTANLLLYGKANPVDAVDILGPHVRCVHAKDGRWPTDPYKFGEEVLIGKGLVNFREVFTKLHRLGYTGAISIEREISGPQQIEDIRKEKVYLEHVIKRSESHEPARISKNWSRLRSAR